MPDLPLERNSILILFSLDRKEACSLLQRETLSPIPKAVCCTGILVNLVQNKENQHLSFARWAKTYDTLRSCNIHSPKRCQS